MVLIASGAGTLLYFGARHSREAQDPQARRIEELWIEFRPDVALTEGGVPPLASSPAVAVVRYGEAGQVRFLAARDHVEVLSLDPSDEKQVAGLLLSFPADRVKLFFLLRRVADLRKQQERGADLVPLAEAELRRLSLVPGLDGNPRSLRDVGRAVPAWRDTPESWFNPLASEAFTNEITRELSQIRDRHMVNVLVAQMEAGRRVFAVAGRTHLVMQEPALRNAAQKPVSKPAARKPSSRRGGRK